MRNFLTRLPHFVRLQFQAAQRRRLCLLQQHSQRKADGDTGDPLNDIAGNTGPSTLEMIEDNLASMTEIAQANGIQVVLCSVLPVADYPWAPGLEPAEKIVELNAWIKKYAVRHGAIYLDYYTSVVDARKGMKAEYSEDGVHPNAAGYNVMEPLDKKAVKKALSRVK